ncbi:FAD-dependent thymidylate synthase [Sulfurimonas sp. HSL-3221]|uniref:FAD-dependent thymidylate synthase n=1 Tax=Sulfurimonadaceae TaxID=2771471 RepID=UPI001E5A09C9|nr:FAD-dependent thymidylate synthase [Sulfurimonas sp. HSL-3221]UFS62529.1 FAD-dependent thymidylate synthase [Sulfurimonas sp. HSL-3221]
MQVEFLEVDTPSNVAVSAARTCYFPNGIVTPDASASWSRKDDLLQGIFKGGHHTTLMHTHVTMLISGMSRHLIWRLLHAHPYYNSEQVSQRYAKMKIENFVYPAAGERSDWETYYQHCFDDYEQLIEVLLPDVEAVVPKFRRKDSRKKAQEMARYVLPGGMSAYLYHTVNIITLLRYIAVAKAMPECRAEAEEFAAIIAEALVKVDASLAPLVEHAKEAAPVFPAFDMAAHKAKIGVGDEAVKVYDVVGDAAFDVNENYADVLRFSQMLPDSGVLGGFSTYTRLSLSADAQNQRHRRSPAVRPALESIYARNAYTPPIISKNPEALAIYERAIARSYDFFEAQRELLGFGEAAYALSNAHEIELVERDEFTSFHHKAQMRLCYNAQEEIFDIVYGQVKQLRAMGVPGAEELLPPCATRFAMKIRPTCPEGDHFCGIKVWKLEFEDYKREI